MKKRHICSSNILVVCVVSARRTMFLKEESVDTVVCELLGRNVMYRYFGSQSEGII